MGRFSWRVAKSRLNAQAKESWLHGDLVFLDNGSKMLESPTGKCLMGIESEPRLSERLNLAYPYDWSNPQMPVTALVRMALVQAHLPDLTRLAAHVGIDVLQSELATMPADHARSAAHVLPNIRAAILDVAKSG